LDDFNSLSEILTMTTVELINITAKKTDIRESEAKLFFDLFIKCLSDSMKPGESVKLSDVGYFHLRTAQKTADSREDEKTGSEKDKIYVILFSKELEQMDDLENNIIFNIHDIPEGEHDEIDSYFSLSVGKPVFPVEGVTDGKLFTQQTGIELRKTLFSKAEQLISTIEKLEGVMGKEEIVLENSLLSKRKSESLSDKTPITGEDTFPSAEDIRKREFNFGKNIASQIKNETTPEPGKGVKPKTGMDESSSEKLPWNFGREVFDKKVDYKREETEAIPAEKEKDEEEPVEEIKTEKLSDELIETKEDEPETSPIIDKGLDTDGIDFRIEQEEEQTEKEIEHDEKLKSVIDDYITRDEPEKFGAYERVESFVSNIEKDKNIDKTGHEVSEEKVESELAEIEEETTENGFMEVQSKSTEYHLDDDKAKIKKGEETGSFKKSSREDKYLYKRSRRSIVPFLVAFFAIVFVVAIVYLYLESDTIFQSEEVEEDVLSIVRPASVTVIERGIHFSCNLSLFSFRNRRGNFRYKFSFIF